MYKLVDMSRTQRSDDDDNDVDGDHPRCQTDPLTDDPINNDGNGDPDDIFEVETTDRRRGLSVLACDLFASVGCVSFCLLVVAAAMALALWLFYLGFVRTPLAAVDRMVVSECNITSHSLISTKTRDDGTGDEYIPGLGVRFAIKHDGGDTDASAREAIARPRIRRDESWMVATQRDAYFGRFPVGAVARCYYSREQHDFVAMSDKSNALRHALAWAVALAVVASVVLFCCCVCLVFSEVEHCRRLRADTSDTAAASV
nr:hypothetical protein [Pandoravirus belohorizontensis]